jgi:hypothetical protein
LDTGKYQVFAGFIKDRLEVYVVVTQTGIVVDVVTTSIAIPSDSFSPGCIF